MTTTIAAPSGTRRPSARRFAGPGWRDPRLWLGVGLLAVSMVAGALVLADRSAVVLVLRATRDLSVGAVPADLVPVSVPADVAAAYLRPGDEVAGVLRWPVAAGDLLPRAAVGPGAAADVRAVTVAIDPLHAPTGLAPGDLVDLWSTPAPTSSVPDSAARTVLASVLVLDVGAGDTGLGGELSLTLRVPAGDVGTVVQAGRGGVLDVVAVPVDAQAPTVGTRP